MNYKVLNIILVLIIIGTQCLAQTITSGKSSLYVKTKKEEKVVDSIPPIITIISPGLMKEEIFSVKENELSVIGSVSDESGIRTLFVNSEPVTLGEGDLFASEIILEEGENRFSLIAIDNQGNHAEAKYIISYNPELVFRTLNGRGNYYALIIGIDEYLHPTINNLDNPIYDATTLREILISKYTFQDENVSLLKNAKRGDIILALDYLANKLTPDDNLLIFYAGHGWWDETANIGYWLPSDAAQTNKTAWFRNSTLCDYLKEIKTKHTLLIADACFGGSIFKSRSVFFDADKAINKLYELPSRKAMTSGTLTEVPDKSSFTGYLIERLSENTDKYLSSEQLFSSFRIAVINNSDAVPQYGEIRNVGDEGGDFIFIIK